MQSWKDYRNFRKFKNADGSFTYTITVDGEPVEVSMAVYEAYAQGGYKMENMEIGFKCDRILKGSDGRAVRDEHGNSIFLPEREVSLDKLVDDEDWQYQSTALPPERIVLAQLETEALRNAFNSLKPDERALIDALFFEGLSEREYSTKTGIAQKTINDRKNRVLRKLKKIM